MNIRELTALELAGKFDKKEVSVKEAVDVTFDAVENGNLNAFITVEDREKVSKKVEAAQKRVLSNQKLSKLDGVPIAVKDNICTAGLRTTCASKMLENFVPPYSASAVKRLEAAGAIIVGKTNMDEFAMGSTSETSYFGAPKNPANIEYVTGGSSGGSAAAVAGEIVCVSLGSDTGGSIRQPASYCGVTGFKPTYGTVSRFGLIAYASSLDQIGSLARDADDCAAVTDIIKGKDRFDGTSLEIDGKEFEMDGCVKGLKIAMPEECFSDAVDSAVRNSVLKAADVLRSLGAIVENISMSFFEYVVPAYYIMATAEASSNLSRFDGVKYGFRAKLTDEGINEMYAKTRAEGFGKEVKKRILLGAFALSSGYYDAYYLKALRVKNLVKLGFDEVFSKFDAVLTPTAPNVAPKLGESLTDPLKMYLSDIFTVSANLAGLPAVSFPCGAVGGLPVGAQIMGQRLNDGAVLNIAKSYQKAVTL